MIQQQNAPVNGSNPVRPNSKVGPEIAQYLWQTQKSPPGSEERKRYFNRLMRCLERYLSYNPYNLSREDFDEVKNNVREALYKAIDKLEPDYIIPWITRVIRHKSNDMIEVLARSRKISLDQTTDDSQSPLLQMIAHPEPDPLIVAVNDLVEKDPHNMLQKTMRGRSDITYQSILKLRLQGYQWKELAQLLGKTIPTLSSFDKREIKRLNSYLRAALLS